MALAAATAVIAPAALLAAPTAYAEDAPTTQSTSGSTGTTDGTDSGTDTTTDTDPSDDATTGDTDTAGSDTAGGDSAGTDPSDDEPDTGTAGDTDGENDPADGTGDETDPADGDDPADDTEGDEDPADDTDPGTEPGDEEPDTKPGDDEGKEEDEDPADMGDYEPCEPVYDEDGDMVDAESALQLDINGLPGKIVAGSGWHTFNMTASNTTDKALGEVRWVAFVDNYSESENEDDWLSEHSQLQYLDPNTKTWKSIADFEFMGKTELGAKDVVDIQLRLNIDADAPAGDSFAIGFGAYLDADEECYRESVGFWEFSVLAPGAGNPTPGEPKPMDPPKQPAQPVSPKEPQGGVKEIAVTGSLAETGSSSAVPMFALAGGAAVAVGVGAMFVVRRRQAGSEA
ncbi:LPXTG cell wall anchor domain-containing protein [Streptomyces sp. ISL-96]|nr:LPXTG cell wall anchor domain-containing protein [Streptomyces sp. ISL-96]